MILVEIDPDAIVPPYEQVRSQIAAAIVGGRLEYGERLPSIRQLAADLGLAAGTIARAYTELEAEALIAGRGRKGTVVIAATSTGERRRQLSDAAARFVQRGLQLGATEDEILDAARSALRATATPQQRSTDTTHVASSRHH